MKKKHLILPPLFLFFNCFGQKTIKTSVYFEFNQYVLSDHSSIKLDSLIRNKSIEHVYLQGHCDSIGNNEYNDALSMKRVLEVKKYLVAKKVSENSIEIRALGKRAPLNNNKSENTRALNRRVDIEFTTKATRPATTTKKVQTKTIVKDSTKNKTQKPSVPESLTKEVEITGIVLDEKKQPVIAEISLNDKNGNEILSISNGKDGKYKFKTTLNRKEDYTLVYYSDETFIDVKTINTSNPKLPYRNLTTILPKLKGGKKYVLKSMNFFGDTSQLIPASTPSLFALYKLMKKNKSLIIRIEGHVNHPLQWNYNQKDTSSHHLRYHPPGMNQKEFNQWLSNERAQIVYNYLTFKGIDPIRMSAIGYGATKMLFPLANNAYEMEQNRRVEINVISLKD